MLCRGRTPSGVCVHVCVFQVSKVWMRLSARKYSQAFEKWREVLDDHVREGKESEFHRVVRTWSLRAMVGGLRKHHAAVQRLAFSVWKSASEEVGRFNGICQRVLRRWRAQSVSRCFREWCDFSAARRRARTLAGRVFGRVLHGKAASAWATWVGAVRFLRHYELVCGKATSRMKQGFVHRAFVRWCDFLWERQNMRYLVRVAELCLRHCFCSCVVFAGWEGVEQVEPALLCHGLRPVACVVELGVGELS